MHQISDLLKRLAGNERSKLMARKMPDDLARLHIGDPFFQTPEHICLAALDAMREGYTNYAPFPGDLELREAICRFLKSDFGAHFHSAEILVTQGASEAIFCAIMGYINPGDKY